MHAMHHDEGSVGVRATRRCCHSETPIMLLSRQDIINLILLGIFVLPFVIVIRQLFIEDAREIPNNNSKEASNKKE
jgi:hypothetical protein